MQTNLAQQSSLAADKVNRWTHKHDHAEAMLEKWQKRRNRLTTQQADNSPAKQAYTQTNGCGRKSGFVAEGRASARRMNNDARVRHTCGGVPCAR